MSRIVRQHLGVWIVAIALLASLGVSSAMPGKHDASQDSVTSQQQVSVPRGAMTLYQDYTGEFTTYRRAVANGTY
ncbi:MAG: hypothetical protein P1U65_00400 [Minwuia sp.]|nr:hypothetical protein [Minwuia sp.]